MSAQTIFVTGAAGFVGSRLTKRLLERGDRVIGHDNVNDYYALEHKERHLRDLTPNPNFTFIKGDLRDAEHLKQVFTQYKPAKVAHLAAMAAVRYSVKHPLIYGEVNVQGTMNLMDAARTLGHIPCLLTSTGSVYGTNTPIPFKEDAAADRPLAPYSGSKRAMEMMGSAFSHMYKLPVTILRFFNVYGPHGRPDMMPWLWTQMINRGEPLVLYVDNGKQLLRDWTYVDDIVDGFVLAIDQRQPADFEIFNLGCGNPVENIRFIRVLESLLGKKAKIREEQAPPSEMPVMYADTGKASRVLGYKPKVMIEEGLRRFVEWMRAEKII